MKLDKKGFVMVETLIVTVFIAVTFTFIYSSVVPLIGVYKNLENSNQVDNVYKLYHFRKFIYNDANAWIKITNNNYGTLACTDFSNSEHCNLLLGYLSINSTSSQFFFVKDLVNQKSTILADSNVSDNIKEYLNSDNEFENSSIILINDGNVVDLGLAKNLSNIYLYN